MRLWACLGEQVLLEIVVTAALALLCISGIVRWTRLAAANARNIGAPAGKPDGLFRGGVMGRRRRTVKMRAQRSGQQLESVLSSWPAAGR
jgi:hypothetical protein